MAQFTDDIFFASTAELQRGIRDKRYTSVELTRAFCDRMERLGPRFGAMALSMRETAMRQAHDADGYFLRDRVRSPLQGIPFGVKDLVAAAGGPTTWGAKPYAGQMFEEDATVLKRLLKVGGVNIAKLSMVELAGGGGYRFAAASLQGPGLNPWDRTRWSGGSSSGSGAAVAAGLVPYALGSETSGSILTPAAFCGVTGLRPTYGLAPRTGCMALSWTLDKIGPLARSAEDCALVLQAIAGGDADDPGSAGKRFYYAPQFATPLSEVRVGYHPGDFTGGVAEETRAAFGQALDAVAKLGVRLVEVKIPDYPYGAMVSTIISAEMGSIFEELVESGKVDELADRRQIAGIKASQEVTAKDYLRAMRLRRLVQQDFAKLFYEQADLLLSPSRTTIANKISEPLDRPLPSGTPMIPAGNLAGLPALSLPCGFANGMPVGIALVGPAYSENKLLAFGNAFQKLTDWHRKRPPA
ncbi:MAG: amidase [Bryobacterales bacterium]|nr:amidase [Bryobacterales bacterium]